MPLKRSTRLANKASSNVATRGVQRSRPAPQHIVCGECARGELLSIHARRSATKPSKYEAFNYLCSTHRFKNRKIGERYNKHEGARVLRAAAKKCLSALATQDKPFFFGMVVVDPTEDRDFCPYSHLGLERPQAALPPQLPRPMPRTEITEEDVKAYACVYRSFVAFVRECKQVESDK